MSDRRGHQGQADCRAHHGQAGNLERHDPMARAFPFWLDDDGQGHQGQAHCQATGYVLAGQAGNLERHERPALATTGKPIAERIKNALKIGEYRSLKRHKI